MPPKKSKFEIFQEGLAKSYGDRVVKPNVSPDRYDAIPTGSIVLDHALYFGGWTVGRVHELVGRPDSAKTLLMINSAVNAQAKYPDKPVGYVDVEKTFDDAWAQTNGLDLSRERWTHLKADHAEHASDMVRKLVFSGLYSMVILDSVGAMESKKVFEKDAEDPLPGANAQVVSRLCKHVATLSWQTGTTVLLVNQIRKPIGKMESDISAGSIIMQHATTTRVQIAQVGGAESYTSLVMEAGEDAETISKQFRARVTRSKIFPPGRKAEFWANNRATEEYGPAGINKIDQYASMAIRCGYAVKDGEGSYYRIHGHDKRINGRKAVGDLLRGSEQERKAMDDFLFAKARADAVAADIASGKPD
jgi:recombination protein RecA